MIYYVYDLLLFLTLFAYTPFYVRRQRRGNGHSPDLLQRLGLTPPRPSVKRGFRVLIHSVSVGETRAVMPLIKELRTRRPDWEIFLTTTTGTGREAAEQMAAKVKLDGIYYFPLDFGPVCKGFLRRVRPDLICLTETEIWPNFIRAAAQYNIPVCLINGRLSDHSFRNYRLFRPLVRPLLKSISLFCMQSQLDAARILTLGATPDSVQVTGNIKFDMGLGDLRQDEIEGLRKYLGLMVGQYVLVAGSTHPGEDEVIVDAFSGLLPSYPSLILVIAPRHIERACQIAQMVKARGEGRPLFWSKGKKGIALAGGDILIIDEIGVLARIYSIATIVFIGGSLIPHGGQNPLEPAFFEKPVVFGPHMENFRVISRMLLEKGGAIELTPEQITKTIDGLLRDEKRRAKMGRSAKGVVEANQGAARKTCGHIFRIIEGV